jgi:hypothetical protein
VTFSPPNFDNTVYSGICRDQAPPKSDVNDLVKKGTSLELCQAYRGEGDGEDGRPYLGDDDAAHGVLEERHLRDVDGQEPARHNTRPQHPHISYSCLPLVPSPTPMAAQAS